MEDYARMAQKIIIKGLDGIDGEYDLDIGAMLDFGHPETLTQGEAHKIKKATGLRLGELEDAVDAGDSDMVIAFALVVLDRAKKRYDIDSLWAAPLGSVMLEEEQNPASDEADPVDPLSPSESNGSLEQSETNGGGSGKPPSELNHPNGPSPTGDTTSATPISDPVSVHPI